MDHRAIDLLQAGLPSYEARRKDGSDGYCEMTRLREVQLVDQWLNGTASFGALSKDNFCFMRH